MTPSPLSWCLGLVLSVAGIVALVFLILRITVFRVNLGARVAPWGWELLRCRHEKCASVVHFERKTDQHFPIRKDRGGL
jgi:hypothetical protein